MDIAQNSPLIFCFGDSLTAGYQTPSPAHPQAEATPYGQVLQERLGNRGRVEISGVCGEVTGEMVLRFRSGAESSSSDRGYSRRNE